MRKARFRVTGRLHLASRVTEGTVIIERSVNVFSVRPLHSRTYDLPLDKVADMVVQRIIKTEVFLKKVEKAKRKDEQRKARNERANFKRHLKEAKET